ncbi:MAG TPA: histidine phosphatase family protein [Trebonia sp.]|nr:histidine phosphatase family protein [Trebonia sp.]
MSAGRRLVLWRHGQTTWNVEHRFQGQTDIPLDETGLAQAGQAAARLAALRPAALFSSDLSRAQQTAAPLAALTGLPVTLDKDLRERYGGDWEGLGDAEIRERYPAERATWNPPNGEPTVVVADRVAAALERIAGVLDEGQLAIAVGHGAALRLGMERILGIAVDGMPTLGSLVNCSWSVLELRGGHWRLNEYNVVVPDVATLAPSSFSDPTRTIPEAQTGDDQ